jgi:hypothetical protein
MLQGNLEQPSSGLKHKLGEKLGLSQQQILVDFQWNETCYIYFPTRLCAITSMKNNALV